MITVLGTIAVVVHAFVVWLHGQAHAELGVELNSFQETYAAMVIVAAPVVAAVLLWTRYSRAGLLLLFASMAGSLAFGSYYHYLTVSLDHVSHLPAGDAQSLFRLTAFLLLLSETFGLAVGSWGLRRSR